MDSSNADIKLFLNDEQEFIAFCSKVPSDKLQISYFELLNELIHSISTNDFKKFKKIHGFVARFISNYKENDLNEWRMNTNSPLRSTNLIILCCKFNRTAFLKLVLEGEKDSHIKMKLKNISELLGEVDNEQHNALYYAIRNENIEIINILLEHISNKELPDYDNAKVDQILAETYAEILLKDIKLSEEVMMFVEKKLFELRFECRGVEESVKERNDVANDEHEAKIQLNLRIDFLLDNIERISTQYSDKNHFDQTLVFICQSIAKDIHILKKKLRSTYLVLPWEEMEFIVIAFVLYHTGQHKFNLVYSSVFRHGKFWKHLNTFASKLKAEKTEIIENYAKPTRLPNVFRQIRVKTIKQEDAEIKTLIEDYETIRDAYTFQKIIESIDLVLSISSGESYGSMVVHRTLQLIGEHLKNSWESPNLSDSSRQLVLMITPKSTIENLKKIRDSLLHSDSLLQPATNGSASDTTSSSEYGYLTNMQNDLRRIKKILNKIIDGKDVQIIRQYLKEIMDSKTTSEAVEIASIFNKIKTDYTDLVKPPLEKVSEIRSLVEKVENYINVADNNDIRKCIKQISSVLDKAECELGLIANVKFQSFNTMNLIKHTIESALITDYDAKAIKDLIRKTFMNLERPDRHDNLAHIADIVKNLYRQLKSRLATDNSEMVDYLVMESLAEILIHCEGSFHQMRCIEDLKYEISHEIPKNLRKVQGDRTHACNEILPKLFEKLGTLLSKYESCSYEYWKLYEKNQSLQAAIQITFLDIIQLLSTNKKFMLISNLAYLDASHPVLTSKDLRNYLAHHHSIVDILPQNINRCLFLNAFKILQEFKCGSFKKAQRVRIGKTTEEDFQSYKNHFIKQLEILRIQNELFIAQQRGQSSEVNEKLEAGADLKARDIHRRTCLHYAAKSDNLLAIDELISAGVDLYGKDLKNYTPVHVSVENNNLIATKHFLQKYKFDVNGVSRPNSQTLLHIAARKGSSDMIRLLLKHNADPKVLYFEHSPLTLSIESKNTEAAKTFIQHLKNIDSQSYGDFTLLHMAAEMQLTELVDILIERGADIHAKNEKSATVLHMACLGGSAEIVDRLLQHDARLDVNQCNVEGYTALNYASKIGDHKIFEILLNRGADSSIADMYGNTPLHYLCKNGNVEAVEVLIAHGVDLNARNKELFAPIHYAAGHGHTQIVDLLIANKATLTVNAKPNLTPLFLAACNGHVDVVKLLLENGAESCANISLLQSRIPIDFHLQPVCIASSNGHLDVVQILLSNKEISLELATYLLERGAQNGHANIVSYFLKLKGKITENTVKAAAKYPSVLELFLQHANNVDMVDADGLSVLHYSALNGNFGAVKRLIEHNANINLMTKEKEPASVLILAIRGNQGAIAKLLLEMGAVLQKKSSMLKEIIELHDLDVIRTLIDKQTLTESDKATSLKAAICFGYVEVVELLLKREIFQQTVEKLGADFLCLSAMRQNKRICQMFLAKGVNIDSAMDDNNQTPLFFSVVKRSYEMTKFLIEHSANVNCKTHEGITPLIYASKYGSADIVQLLIDNGANSFQADYDGRTALEFAVSTNQLDCVKVLVNSKKVDIKKMGAAKFALLHIAAQEGGLEVIKFLCENGADMHIRNGGGSEPIHIAAREGHINVVEYFIEKGVSVDERAGNNHSGPLHLAASANQLQMITYLVQHGANVNLEAEHKFTPLDVAFQFNNVEAVQLLLQLGAVCTNRPSNFPMNTGSLNLIISSQELFEAIKSADQNNIVRLIKQKRAQVNARNSQNATILHIASWKGYLECVKVILSNDGDPNITGKGLSTALHYASKFDHFEIVRELLAHGAIYNSKTELGKTANELANNEKIQKLLNLISNTFMGIKNKSYRTVTDLSTIKDFQTLKAIVNAKNEKHETIVLAAMKSAYPHSILLQQMHQKIDPNEFQCKLNELLSEERFTELITFLWQTRKQRTELFGKQCPGNLYLDSLIAHTTYYQAKYSQALQLTDHLYQKEKKIFGETSRYTLKTMTLKSLILFRQGQSAAALEIIEKVDLKQREVMKPTDEDYFGIQNALGLIYQEVHRYDEALAAYERSFNGTKSIYGINSQQALAAQNNMAMVLGCMGKDDESLKMFNDVYNRRLKHLGRNHSDTLRTRQNIIRLEFKEKNHNSSVDKLEQILREQTKTLGSDHVDTIKTETELAIRLFEKKLLHLAYTHLENVLPKALNKLGPQSQEYKQGSIIMNLIKTTMFMTGRNDSGEVLQYSNNNFFQAIEQNDINMIKSLLNNGANVNARNMDGFTPLHLAIRNNSKEICSLLLYHSADPTQASNIKENTPLHIAASMGYTELAEILLQHVKKNNLPNFYGFINGQTKNGRISALHLAAKNGFVSLVKLLLKHGAVFELIDVKGLKPRDMAMKDEIKTLLTCCDELFLNAKEKGASYLEEYSTNFRANPDVFSIVSEARNANNETILEIMMRSPEDIEMCLAALREFNINVNST